MEYKFLFTFSERFSFFEYLQEFGKKKCFWRLFDFELLKSSDQPVSWLNNN